jgi:hypothetical protein
MSKSGSTGARRALWLLPVLVGGPGASLRAVEFDGRLPIGRAKLVYPHGDSTLPSYAGSFLARYEGDLYVDPLLGTLRYFSPRERIGLFRPGERNEYTLVQVALRFIRENSEVFGCGDRNLESPLELRVDAGNVLLVFRQTDGLLPIAGATIRMVIGGSFEDYGLLKSVKGFTLRDPPSRFHEFASLDAVGRNLSALGISRLDLEVIRAFSGANIPGRPFIRGDANQDLTVELSDAISVLDYLFNGSLDDRCLDTMDADGDRELAVTDAIYLIQYQFLGGTPPPPPFPGCSVDPQGGDAIPCREYPCKP